MSVAETALDAAADIIAAACGVTAVSRTVVAEEPEYEAFDDGDGAALVIALATGTWTETGYCIGAATPYEFEHDAPFQVLAIGGDDAARAARVAAVVEAAKEAIATDPTLGGLVDHAEFVLPDTDDAERTRGLAAILRLTFTAPDGLG